MGVALWGVVVVRGMGAGCGWGMVCLADGDWVKGVVPLMSRSLILGQVWASQICESMSIRAKWPGFIEVVGREI